MDIEKSSQDISTSSSRRRKWFIIGGLAVAAVACFVLGIASKPKEASVVSKQQQVTSSSPSTPGSTANLNSHPYGDPQSASQTAYPIAAGSTSEQHSMGSIDFDHGVAVGVPKRIDSSNPDVWVMSFGNDCPTCEERKIACWGRATVDHERTSFSKGNCGTTVSTGVPVRFHFVYNDRMLYAVIGEDGQSEPRTVDIWQASRAFRRDAATYPKEPGVGWNQFVFSSVSGNGIATNANILNTSTGQHLTIGCVELMIVDRTLTARSKAGLAMVLPLTCPTLDGTGGVRLPLPLLATHDDQIYYYGVNDSEGELSRPRYEYIRAEND
jgi:hypothetical protein